MNLQVKKKKISLYLIFFLLRKFLKKGQNIIQLCEWKNNIIHVRVFAEIYLLSRKKETKEKKQASYYSFLHSYAIVALNV